MYAVVDIAGKQFKVTENLEIFTPKLGGEPGSKIDFTDVLLIEDEGKIKVGEPLVKGARVTGKILQHLKGDKVIVFKKKRRKGYQVKNGHRQEYSKVLIENIK